MFTMTLTGPSGAGKTTMERLVCQNPRFHRVISHTTREPREGEVDGVDYHFINKDEFARMDEAGEFAETAHPHGNSYGALSSEFLQPMAEEKIPFFVCDPVGAEAIKHFLGRHTVVSLFLLPPSFDVLEQRIRDRSSITDEEVARRLLDAADWIAWGMHHADYLIQQTDKSIDFLMGAMSLEEQKQVSIDRTVTQAIDIANVELARSNRNIPIFKDFYALTVKAHKEAKDG